VKATALDVAAVIDAALCEECRAKPSTLAYTIDSRDGIAVEWRGSLCEECRSVVLDVRERLRAGVHPDALRALAARILGARGAAGGTRSSHRRVGRTKAEVTARRRGLAAKRKHPGRKPKAKAGQ
jgi:hypothetical protein